MTQMDSLRISEALTQNLENIKSQMQSACDRYDRNIGDIKLVVVSKYRPIDQINVQYELGERHFGESRIQDARKKIPEFAKPASWHLIGQLQTNKAKYLPGLFDWVHSVDREDAIEALEKAYSKKDLKVHVLIQVNIAGEEQKAGCKPEEAKSLVELANKSHHIIVEGLMTMAPYADDPELARPHFRNLASLRDQVSKDTGIALPHLSMGMSGDFEIAIEEGATLIRVGSKLYELPED